MKLEKIRYSQFEGQPREWMLDCLELEDTNLLVGKNASGKSKTINFINGLAKLLSGQVQPSFLSGKYDATFDNDGVKLNYLVEYTDSKVTKERFESDGKLLLERGAGGVGQVFAEKQGKLIEFQTPESQLAAIARRDLIQHSFFEPLFKWGSSVFYIPFGTPLGKDNYAMFIKETDNLKRTEPKNAEEVVAFFKKGEREIGSRFAESVKEGMCSIGYPIQTVSITNPLSFSISIVGPGGLPSEISCLSVQEDGLTTVTDQNEMSQGMFRALSIIIHVTYAELVSHPSCILIDDIGEGLDFDRAAALIELLIARAGKSKIQFIMSTNDRFVMNRVPLKSWSILKREHSHIHAYNYKNSKDLFDRFEFTGLNNFDFFSMDFVNKQVSA